jgi:hypothetical protein
MTQHKIYSEIISNLFNDYYKDLGSVSLSDDSGDNINIIKIKVVPFEGFHKEKEYIITLKFIDDKWPLVYIDSDIYDKIKTKQYLENRGLNGEHKGICIKHIGHGYPFKKNFKDYCGNKWNNYIYNIIVMFNNLQDFEKGTGIHSNYKNILSNINIQL